MLPIEASLASILVALTLLLLERLPRISMLSTGPPVASSWLARFLKSALRFFR